MTPIRLQVYTFVVAASLSSTYLQVRLGYPLAGVAPRCRLGLHFESNWYTIYLLKTFFSRSVVLAAGFVLILFSSCPTV